MRTSIMCVIAAGAIGLLAMQLAAAESPAEPKEFLTEIVVTEMRDGRQAVLAQPNLTTREGEDATLVVGGEVVDPETGKGIPIGIRARVKVRELDGGKLRVSINAGTSILDAQDETSFVVREMSAHCVMTLAPGEKREIDLGAGRKLAVTISPAAAKK